MKINPEDLLNQEWKPFEKTELGLQKTKERLKKNRLKDYKKHYKKRRAVDDANKKRYIHNLEDPYVKATLRNQGILNPDSKMIELKRANMMLKREMTRQKQAKKNLEKKLTKNIPKQLTFEYFDGMKDTYSKFLGKK